MLRGETIALLERYGLIADPSKDEQQLVDSEIIGTLIRTASVGGSDTVLEVGPGAGNITVELANVAGRVVAVERDEKWLAMLRDRLIEHGNVEIVIGDALKVRFPSFTKVVSNLPYSIAEAMVQRLTRLRFEAASLLVPLSFIHTVTASRGDDNYSRLSYSLQLFFTVEKISEVPPVAYYPEPRTTTAILALKRRPTSSPVEAVMKELVRQRDKILGNALRESIISNHRLGYPGAKRQARAMVAALGFDNAFYLKRVGALSLDELLIIQERMEKTLRTSP